MARKPQSNIYTADFILALISLGLQFGWTISGLPPCIELACACWAIMLGVVLHCFWISTRNWKRQRWTRFVVLVAVPILILSVFWKPFKNRYIIQHSPRAITDHAQKKPNEILWYLKMDYVQCDPPIDPMIGLGQRIYPFRIKVKVNSRMVGSFPFDLFAYAGLTNTLEGGGAILLESDVEQYSVDFLLQRLNTPRGQENDLLHSNLLTTVGYDQNPFKITDLPITVTNLIPLSERFLGKQIKVVYEITTNR